MEEFRKSMILVGLLIMGVAVAILGLIGLDRLTSEWKRRYWPVVSNFPPSE